MTTEPNRQPEGIPAGGQFAKKTQSDNVVSLAAAPAPPRRLGLVLSERYFAAKAQMDAHDQNEWVRDVHEDHPEAAYARVKIETDAGGRYTAGVDLYTAEGEPIELDSSDVAILEDDFDTDWDMARHRTIEAEKLFGFESGVFSLQSIQDRWAEIESSTEAPSDPFAHLTGLAKAKAQGAHARDLSTQAAEAYVEHLTSEILAAQPNAARLNVSREVDVEYGHNFTLQSVINADGEVLDVDLTALQDESFHDIYLDRLVDFDDSGDQNYIDLVPAS